MLICRQIREADVLVFCFNDTATTEIYTLSLHDALPIYRIRIKLQFLHFRKELRVLHRGFECSPECLHSRSEEHTSELQSRQYLVCRLLLEKNNQPSLSLLFLDRMHVIKATFCTPIISLS